MPVVSGSGVVVRAATQSGPVMVESVCVSVPASVGTPALTVPGAVAVVPVVVGVVVVVPVAVVAAGVVTAAAAPPARLMAAPHVAAVPVFVTSASVTISVCPAGTVNAVTAVVPDGTSRVISTMLSTTGVPVVAGDALTVGLPASVVVVVPSAFVIVDDVAAGLVVVCAETPAATRATSTVRHSPSTFASFMRPPWKELGREARKASASSLRSGMDVSRSTVAVGATAAHARRPRRRGARARRQNGDPRFAIRLAIRPW